MSYLDKFKLESLVAALGFNDGANKGFWRIQPRVPKGRRGAGKWIEMGAELRALLKVNGNLVSVIGRSVGSNGTPDGVRVLFQGLGDQGIPDGIVEVPTRFLDLVSASIPDELLKKKGIVKPDAFEEPDQDAPNIEDLARTDITPDDIRIANDGINSPEGKEQAAFKDSPEGKAIEADEAVDDAVEKVREAMDSGTEEDQIAANEELRKAREARDANLKDPADMTDEELKKESSSPSPTNMKRSNEIFKELNKRAGAPDPLDLDRQRYEQGLADEEQRVKDITDPIRESLVKAADGEEGVFQDALDAIDDDLLTGEYKLQSVANAIKSQKLGDIKGSKEKTRQAQYKALELLKAEGVDVGNINRTGTTPAEDREIDGPDGEVTPRMRQAAIRKAAQDIAEGKAVTVDDVITYASKGEPKKPASQLKGQKLSLKPGDMKPGDIFEYKGDEFEFVSAGERDRVSKTQDVTAINRRTGKKEETLLDTDKTTPILRPDAVQPEPAKEPEAPKVAPVAPKAPEAPATPTPAPAAPAAPKAPVAKKAAPLPRTEPAPKAEELAAPERPDNGQEIAFSPLSDEELYNRRVAVVVPDANGKTKKAYNPITGKMEVAQDADAIATTLLQDHPEAVIKPNGEIVLQRKKFTDGAGEDWTLESFVVRTDGANFMVGYRLNRVSDGKELTYYSYDYRDSYASIFGKPADPKTGLYSKNNGIRRISDVLTGEKEILQNQNSPEFKSYFGPGKGVESRVAYFRDKYRSKATEESLAKDLEKAKAGGKKDVIAEAQARYDMLFDKFDGDIDRFRQWDTIQEMRFLTIEETARKYISGRPRRLNESKSTKGGENASQEANVLRSAVPDMVDAILSQDTASITEHMVAAQGRMPMLSKNPEIARLMLDMISDETSKRVPKGSGQQLAGFRTAAYNAWINTTYTPDNANSVPHVGSDGTVIHPGYFVEYENSQGVKSRGYVVSVNERVVNPNKPNEYFDTVNVKFMDSKGNISKATARLWAKNLTTYDKTGDNEVARKQMTQYTPNPRGEDKIAQRFGDDYLQYDSEDPNLGSDGEEGDSGSDGKIVDDYEEGDLHYSKDGELLGEVVEVTPVTNKKGQKGFIVTYLDENGDLQRDTVKAGEFRGPKL